MIREVIVSMLICYWHALLTGVTSIIEALGREIGCWGRWEFWWWNSLVGGECNNPNILEVLKKYYIYIYICISLMAAQTIIGNFFWPQLDCHFDPNLEDVSQWLVFLRTGILSLNNTISNLAPLTSNLIWNIGNWYVKVVSLDYVLLVSF